MRSGGGLPCEGLVVKRFIQRKTKGGGKTLTGRQKGGLVIKGGFGEYTLVPGFRSSLRSGRTCERTLVPVFVLGEHPSVPSFRLSFRGNIRQNHPFGKPPFWQTPKLGEGKTYLKPLHKNGFGPPPTYDTFPPPPPFVHACHFP